MKLLIKILKCIGDLLTWDEGAYFVELEYKRKLDEIEKEMNLIKKDN